VTVLVFSVLELAPYKCSNSLTYYTYLLISYYDIVCSVLWWQCKLWPNIVDLLYCCGWDRADHWFWLLEG